MNLLSIHKFCLHSNYSCHFDANEIKIQDFPTGRLLYRGLSENGVYPIYSKFSSRPSSSNFTPPKQKVSTSHTSSQLPNSSIFHVHRSHKWLLWHHRLGHPSDAVLNSVVSSIDNSVDFSKSDIVSYCKHCLSGKMHQLSFDKSDFHSTKPLELIHNDVWGPAPVSFVNDFRYYLVLIDDFTKFTWVYLLKYKSDVFDIFKYFKATIENQLDSKIKILKTDGGGEFTSKAFNLFC